MVQARYQYAIDVMLTRLRMIDADLTEKNERPLIRNLWRDFLNFPYFTGFPAP